MNNIEQIFVGTWYNPNLNLEITISEINRGWKYLFEYQWDFKKEGNRIESEVTELRIGAPGDNVVHFENNLGSWNLILTSKDSFELSNENPVTGKVKILVFERKFKPIE